MKGRVILAEPYKGISDQIASEAWENQDRGDQLFVNHNIENTLRSFKKTDKESIRVKYETSLRGATIPSDKDLVIHCTYNQIMNISHDDMATIDYIFIDECHTLSDGLNYRADVISGLIYYLVEFIAKKRKSKTKIVFMSGTPNVETHVIPELMEEYNIKSLFQRIIVDKEYKVRPTIYLTHLDTKDSTERQNAVINQINSYIKQGRKVCHIFNNKSKMDQYIREIQSKLSKNIKVGLFYSGSTGECTRNILSGKIGDYDVLLTTTYFINGINIDRDGLTEDEISKGVPSTQKYGVVIDLGKNHTKVNAMDAIQAINRFRNRRCHCTVFLPQIFKPDLNNPSKNFEFRNAGKVLLGINKYNYHLLSINPEVEEEEVEDEVPQEKLFFLEKIRSNPLKVSLEDLSRRTREEENKNNVVNKILKKSRLYEDWFNSLDGYHYLAKDAGFLSIIKHKSVEDPLKEMTEDQIELENKLILNFLRDEKAIMYLINQLEPNKRIWVKSSGAITDPMSTTIGNLDVIELINGKYIIEGDFHSSHERGVNNLISCHLRLSYLYGSEEALDLLKLLVNSKSTLLRNPHKSHLNNIVSYVSFCRESLLPSIKPCHSYLYGLDILSSMDLGVTKYETETSLSYTIEDPSLADKLKDEWANSQYDMILHKIESSSSEDKEGLKAYYSNKQLVKDYDLSELKNELSLLGDYKEYRYSKITGKLLNNEEIIINKIVRSAQLYGSRIQDQEVSPPLISTLRDLDIKRSSFKSTTSSFVTAKLTSISKVNPLVSAQYETEIVNRVSKGDYLGCYSYISSIIEKNKSSGLLLGIESLYNSIRENLLNFNSVYYSAFQTAEYLNYRDYTLFKSLEKIKSLIFCSEEITLEKLSANYSPTAPPPVSMESIYDMLFSSYKKRDLRFDREVWIVLNNGLLVGASLSKIDACKEVCYYAFNNEPFILKSGSLPKIFNKGVYNPSTFRRVYLNTVDEEFSILNYELKIVKVEYIKYRDYLKSLKKK